MIVGADGEKDSDILQSSATLYAGYKLKRVYYSAYSPIPGSSQSLPARKPPLMREHRLYQADWLYRYYGFAMDEVLGATDGGMLDLDLDPKLAWALRNRGRFPIDVNRSLARGAAARAGLGRPQRRPHHRHPPPDEPPARRRRQADALGQDAPPVRHRARLDAGGRAFDGAHLAGAVKRPAAQLSLF